MEKKLNKKVAELKEVYKKISEISDIFEQFEKNFSREERSDLELIKKVLDLVNQLEKQVDLFYKVDKEILDELDEGLSCDESIEDMMNMSHCVLSVLSYVRQKKKEFSLGYVRN